MRHICQHLGKASPLEHKGQKQDQDQACSQRHPQKIPETERPLRLPSRFPSVKGGPQADQPVDRIHQDREGICQHDDRHQDPAENILRNRMLHFRRKHRQQNGKNPELNGIVGHGADTEWRENQEEKYRPEGRVPPSLKPQIKEQRQHRDSFLTQPPHLC